MTLVAGLATSTHPYAGTEASVAILKDLIAVPQAIGDHSREDRYRLAAHWCAAGPFLPLSWTLNLSLNDVRSGAATAAADLGRAIAAAAGRIEFAIRIGGDARADGAAGVRIGGSGRDYLRSLKGGRHSGAILMDRIEALARDMRFTLSLVSRRDCEASCLIGCAADDAERVRRAVRALAGSWPELHFDIAGPLPPFGAGAEAVAQARLGGGERSA